MLFKSLSVLCPILFFYQYAYKRKTGAPIWSPIPSIIELEKNPFLLKEKPSSPQKNDLRNVREVNESDL